MNSSRRHDIDWLRVIAIGLLLVYHVAIGFQPWGMMIAFITNKEPWESLWIPMSMLNVWRIPLLFFVSGMGVFLSIQNRNWKQLISERTARIWLPFVFGLFCIAPINLLIWQSYYGMKVNYIPNPGHLWFLGNIFVYVVILSPILFYLKRNQDSMLVIWMKRILSTPLAWFIVVSVFIGEALLFNPTPYEMYAMTWHGFVLGLLAFFFGFCFVLSGDGFWKMIVKWRRVFLVLGLILFALRWMLFQMKAPAYLLVMESDSWIFAVFAFGHKYLNRPSRPLDYLSQAVYPVYILHMIFLYLGSMLVFPLQIDVHLKFLMVLLITLVGCFVVYEFVIRRVRLLRILFGLRKGGEPKLVEA